MHATPSVRSWSLRTRRTREPRGYPEEESVVTEQMSHESLMRYLDGEAAPEERARIDAAVAESTELQRDLAIFRAMKSDLQAMTRHDASSAGFTRIICDAFDILYREAADSGRVVAISLHPYIIGLPHRIDALDRGLEYICGHDSVWRATGAEIADHFLSLQGAFSSPPAVL